MKFRKKPVVIEAVQLRWDTWSEMCDFLGDDFFKYGGSGGQEGETLVLNIPTLEGIMRAPQDDWVIKGIRGEFYPCKPDIFELTYDLVEE